ncbi:MAG: helix-turn-helix transcriptional regulator [Lachnospiraceae bacterium]|nr:helix-turn-helix transcriptional regulator [Lachnospiraceae bacterium]
MPEGDFTRLGNAMRNARKSRGFTQERLSDVSGVSVRHIAKIEKGVINPSFDILEKLITALGTSFDAFYNPATDKEGAELQEIISLYKACPPDGKRLIVATTRALANELMDTNLAQGSEK